MQILRKYTNHIPNENLIKIYIWVLEAIQYYDKWSRCCSHHFVINYMSWKSNRVYTIHKWSYLFELSWNACFPFIISCNNEYIFCCKRGSVSRRTQTIVNFCEKNFSISYFPGTMRCEEVSWPFQCYASRTLGSMCAVHWMLRLLWC